MCGRRRLRWSRDLPPRPPRLRGGGIRGIGTSPPAPPPTRRGGNKAPPLTVSPCGTRENLGTADARGVPQGDLSHRERGIPPHPRPLSHRERGRGEGEMTEPLRGEGSVFCFGKPMIKGTRLTAVRARLPQPANCGCLGGLPKVV